MATTVNPAGAPLDPTAALAPPPALVRRIAAGQCNLFLGAGVHAPHPAGPWQYGEEAAPPRGRALSLALAAECGYEARYPSWDAGDLRRVAAHYASTMGAANLFDAIRDRVTAGRAPSPALRALAGLGFPLVITTNYDDLYEQALGGRPHDKCVYSPDDDVPTRDIETGMPSSARPFILKIHGDVGSRNSFVVTEDDYIRFVLRMSDKEAVNPVPLGVRLCLKVWPTLFIGYSLQDYNLRLLFQTLRWKKRAEEFPTSYAVDPMPDPIVQEQLMGDRARPQLLYIVQDLWTFVPALYRAVKGEDMPA